VSLLFSENPQHKVSLLVRLKCGWDNHVVTGGHFVKICNFSSVDVRRRFGNDFVFLKVISTKRSTFRIRKLNEIRQQTDNDMDSVDLVTYRFIEFMAVK